MNINTEMATREIVVEIDDAEYSIAEKTVEIGKKLIEIDKKASERPQYEYWLEVLSLLLGDKAIKTIFPNKEKANIDKIGTIYFGVLRAFNKNSDDLKQAQLENTLSGIESVSEKLKPIADTMNAMSRDGIRNRK